MGKLFYLGHYSEPGKRAVFFTAQTMMNYVIGAINESGKDLTVISAALAPNGISTHTETSVLNDKTDIIYLSCTKRTKSKNPFLKLLYKHKREKQLYTELDKIISDGDTLLVYHSLAFSKVLKKLRKKKRINLIIQVCEIYADASEGKINRKKELKQISLADKYIFSSTILENELNKEHKPYAICMGTYKVEPQLSEPINDGKIHLVYSGTFNSVKGGVLNALDAVPYLDGRYHMHILGKGDEQAVKAFDLKARAVTAVSDCIVSYDGYHSGLLYKSMLQRFSIGLSTQNPDAEFNNTSFPSKILSYMSNGLRVVSADILPVKSSTLGEHIIYYHENSGEAIANAIKGVDLSTPYDARSIISEHNQDFVRNLQEIL